MPTNAKPNFSQEDKIDLRLHLSSNVTSALNYRPYISTQYIYFFFIYRTGSHILFAGGKFQRQPHQLTHTYSHILMHYKKKKIQLTFSMDKENTETKFLTLVMLKKFCIRNNVFSDFQLSPSSYILTSQIFKPWN